MPVQRTLTDAFGWLRAPAPGSALPDPEPRLRRLVVRGIAIGALVASVTYLTWRATATLDLAVWWASIPLLMLEIHATLGLALFAFSMWDLDRRPAHRDVRSTLLRVAVLVPTHEEGIETLLPTIAAARAIRLRHETWVLDDGARPEVERLARSLGVRYLARTEHAHSKAANVNHALSVVDADLIAILDADHVADRNLLVRTVGYFDDPRVALVQTPQAFYSDDSVEHDAAAGERERFHEQALLCRMLQAGKNRWGGALWCGTGAVVRVAALRDVGGIATDTSTEAIRTTIRLHRHGWRTAYHDEVLARGLAAGDADTDQLQRLRWGTGAMQVLRRESPLWVSGLTLPQRLSYAATLLGWFDAWRMLGFAILPMVVVLTGAVPIRTDPRTLATAFMATFLLQQLALLALSRGCRRPVLSIVFDLVRMSSTLRATQTLGTRRGPAFVGPPESPPGVARTRDRVPLPLRALLVASLLSASWFALTLLGRTFVTYAEPGAVTAAFCWLLLNVALVCLAILRIRSRRHAPERRASVRYDVALPALLGDFAAEARDVSAAGARVVAGTEIVPGSKVRLVLSSPGKPLVLRAVVRSVRRDPRGGLVHGLEFLPGQHRARARLALFLFGQPAQPTVDRASTTTEALELRPINA